MENKVIKKEGEAKPYFQLPTRKTSAINNIQSPSTFTESFKSASSSTTSTESNEFLGNKAFFDKFAKGGVETTSQLTQNPVINQVKV